MKHRDYKYKLNKAMQLATMKATGNNEAQGLQEQTVQSNATSNNECNWH
jgi:hypothetical protein